MVGAVTAVRSIIAPAVCRRVRIAQAGRISDALLMAARGEVLAAHRPEARHSAQPGAAVLARAEVC